MKLLDCHRVGGNFRPNDLQRYWLADALVVGAVHLAHAAARKKSLDPEAIQEYVSGGEPWLKSRRLWQQFLESRHRIVEEPVFGICL
jgi:hypothetical protein